MRKRCPCCIGAILVVLASHQAIAAPQDDAVKAFKEYVAAVRAGSAEKVLALVEPVPESCKPLLAASVESLIAIERVKTAMAKQFALPKDEEAEEEEGWNMGQPSDETLNQLAGDLVDDNTVKLKGKDPLDKAEYDVGLVVRRDGRWLVSAGTAIGLDPTASFVEPPEQERADLLTMANLVTRSAMAVLGRLERKQFKSPAEVQAALLRGMAEAAQPASRPTTTPSVHNSSRTQNRVAS